MRTEAEITFELRVEKDCKRAIMRSEAETVFELRVEKDCNLSMVEFIGIEAGTEAENGEDVKLASRVVVIVDVGGEGVKMYGAVENTGDISNIDEAIDLCHPSHRVFLLGQPRMCRGVSSRNQPTESLTSSATSVDNNVNGEDEMTNYLLRTYFNM
jgi:hypothetical protein